MMVMIKTFICWDGYEMNINPYNVIEWPLCLDHYVGQWAMFPQSRQYPSVQMMMHLV